MDTINNLNEEIFCLRFELNTLSDLLIRGEAERWVHKFIQYQYEEEHLNRYRLVKDFVANKKVLDIACGSGYGSYLLASQGNATEVLGCDLSPVSVRYATHRYKNSNLSFQVENAEQFKRDKYFDMIVSFETIEHLNDYNAFLKNVHASLTDSGTFFVSTPITRFTTTNCGNPYHRIEWGFMDFQKLISELFDIQKVYVQNIEFEQSQGLLSRGARKLKRTFSSEKEQPDYTLKPFDPAVMKTPIASGYQILHCRKK